jgi:hypothetical protein
VLDACVRDLMRGLVTCAVVVVATALPLTTAPTEQPTTAVADAITTARRMSPRAIGRYEESGHVEAFGAYRITVPRSWAENEPDAQLCEWPRAGTPELLTLRANLPSTPCPTLPRGAKRTVNNGAILYWPGAEPSEDVTFARRLLTLRPSTAVVRVHRVVAQPRQLLVKFRDGGYTFQISVSVGHDGEVAGRVIASILPNPDA